ncbi:MAG: hypothetical protein KBI10_01730 [Syntrophorhabdales bacterium]|nr:hypothetical protein [Syntrophorhabdales bacterium]
MKPIIEKDKFLKNFKGIYSKKAVKKKIIIKGLNLLDAFLDEGGHYIPGKSTLIITNKEDSIQDLKFMLGIINSSFCFFYMKNKYPASSYIGGINFTPEMFNNFPLPTVTNALKKGIISIADKILSLTQTDDYLENPAKQARVKEYEHQIDQMVYKLYGLTEEEIKIVEGE